MNNPANLVWQFAHRGKLNRVTRVERRFLWWRWHVYVWTVSELGIDGALHKMKSGSAQDPDDAIKFALRYSNGQH